MDERTHLPGYEGQIRQISITWHRKIKPAIIITNDFYMTLTQAIRKYARRVSMEEIEKNDYNLNPHCSESE